MMKSRIEREKEIIRMMVILYCSKYEKNKELCPNCQAIVDYAYERLNKCQFGISKTICRKCKNHCYKPLMREQVKQIMRYSGPKMMWHNPWAVVCHIIETWYR